MNPLEPTHAEREEARMLEEQKEARILRQTLAFKCEHAPVMCYACSEKVIAHALAARRPASLIEGRHKTQFTDDASTEADVEAALRAVPLTYGERIDCPDYPALARAVRALLGGKTR